MDSVTDLLKREPGRDASFRPLARLQKKQHKEDGSNECLN